MNPFKYAQMMKYLTRAKKAKPDLPDVFPASQAPIPKVKKDVELKDAINIKIVPNSKGIYPGLIIIKIPIKPNKSAAVR